MPLKLGIFVVVLFSLLIVGMLAYKPIRRAWLESRQRTGQIHVRDDFGDGKLNSRFATDSSGTCEFKEHRKAGVFRIDMGTSDRDAGIVYLKDALDITKPMTFRHRARVLDSRGLHGWNLFYIAQNTGYPQCADLRTIQQQQLICVHFRAPYPPYHNGALEVGYVSSSGHPGLMWDQVNSRWVTGGPGQPFVKTTVSDFHLAEFHSDGGRWYVIVRDQSNAILIKTTPVSWSELYNDSEKNYWFIWGDDCTNHFHGDGESDYIDMTYTFCKTLEKEKTK
ncbi:MAG: hypothetical protein E3J72_03185 [Planctomycetota bacterium]|nr:MAG: hypothetical protein E3J72_03185 [Planctomycetota bacterium]